MNGVLSRTVLLLLVSLFLVLPAGCDSGGDEGKVEEVECTGEKPHEFEGTCVACLEDVHCDGEQTCNLATGNCACPGDRPHFDGEKCLACLADSHCPDGHACDLGTNACADLDCPETAPLLLNGSCVACLEDADCGGNLSCLAANHSCGCADPKMKVVDGNCVECTKSTECPVGELCVENLCVGEGQTGNCPVEKPYNYLGECRECLEDAHCEPGIVCHAELFYCVPPALVCEAPTPYKYLDKCVECLETAHCGPGELCNKSQKVCEDEPVSSGECVFGGNGKTIGSQIGDFGGVDCDGNAIHLHDYCGVAKAVWLINVAGWCGACDQYAPQANEMWQQYAGQGLQLIFVLGEDPQGNPPSGSYCKQWAQSHSVTAPVMIDPKWQGIDSRITPGGYDLPWDYLLDGDDMTFVWESVNWSGEVLASEIQKLLAD